jgi:Fur family ferric uptake transcriptional regulator
MIDIHLPRPSLQKKKQNSSLTEADFKKILREMNLKVTTQRLAILKVLGRSKKHVTAQEVFEIIEKNFPDMGFATVYRFLRKLSEHSYVNEIRMGGLPARYEFKSATHHDHLTCIKCEKIVEFENYAIEAQQEKVAEQFGFTLTSHVLELYGICPTCQKVAVLDSGDTNSV